jgi:sulfur-oxidizing protein SoxA
MKVFAALVLALSFIATPAIAQRPNPLKSGIEFQSADVQKLQADDFANPGQLWVTRGEAAWKQPRGQANVGCSSCHAEGSLKGVAARYPRYDETLGKIVNIETRINTCVTSKQRAQTLPWETQDLLALTAYVTKQSRGMPINVSIEGKAESTFKAGESLYKQRIGQLNMACTNCHDNAWGRTLLAEKISQGHPDGWPAYRLEWQSVGSLERRLRACFYGVRAEQPPFGSADLLALELYLAWRAQGLNVSSPGVRR